MMDAPPIINPAWMSSLMSRSGPSVTSGPLLRLVIPSILLGILCAFAPLSPAENAPLQEVTAQEKELPPATERNVDYTRDVQPLLMKTCWTCHGPDEQESSFRVDLRESLLSGGESGEPAIIPGESANSPLIHRAAGKDGWIMPPENQGKPLSRDEIGILRAWIDTGAEMPETNSSISTNHWSFQPLRRPAVPQLSDESAANPIDNFVLSKLAERDLRPTARASRADLIRRVYLDMLGLAPSPEAVEAFANNNSPSAYRDLVEQVLASPHYGERWARHWLDVVRFSESDGFETNHERPNAYRYRDWVIQAFNNDMPYDEFVFAQLAGDMSGQDAATGFLVGGPYDIVKSPDPGLTAMQRQNELADIINTTSTTFLGLTVGCARCHTHKFDPILQADYYALSAVFAGVQHGERLMSLPPQEEARRQQRVSQIDTEIAALQSKIDALRPAPYVGRVVVIDEESDDRVTPLQPSSGHGVNPAGAQRGHKDDLGDADSFPNISGGQYSWWPNQPGQDVLAYHPKSSGKWRVWLSWGCGWDTHSPNAEYILDQDGDPTTSSDQSAIATINQSEFANPPSEAQQTQHPQTPLWSGFRDVGVVDLNEQSAILVRGGVDGTAITADMIVLAEVPETEQTLARTTGHPPLAPPVNARLNVEHFPPQRAKFVRFTVFATNSVEPCLDELEIWSAEAAPRNVALASTGAVATSSGDYSGDPKHQLPHVIDGQYGNEHSWISSTPGGGWVQIELPEAALVDRIVWGRDRNLVFADRLATKYQIEFSLDGQNWTTAVDGVHRVPFGAGPSDDAAYRRAYARAVGTPETEILAADELEAKLNELTAEREMLRARPMVYAGTFQPPPVTHRLYRGDPMAPKEEIAPGSPQVLHQLVGSLDLPVDAPEPERRKRLAEWITAKNNPLTARVIVNRIWHYHFGQGLVATPSDFGAMGAAPSHPELLDWLASELIEPTDGSASNGSASWSLKHIHRLILHSNTYQQASTPNAAAQTLDRNSALLWRFPPRRLEAEAIRDKVLQASGQLDMAMFGPGFLLFVPNDNYSRNWIAKDEFGQPEFRRMIYALDLRMEHDAVFGAFDCPDGGQVAPKRTRSTTPIQSLNLFNSKFVAQQAEAFAQRAIAESGDDVDAQIQRVFALALQRKPTAAEQADAQDLVEQFGLTALCRAMFNSSEFLFLQ